MFNGPEEVSISSIVFKTELEERPIVVVANAPFYRSLGQNNELLKNTWLPFHFIREGRGDRVYIRSMLIKPSCKDGFIDLSTNLKNILKKTNLTKHFATTASLLVSSWLGGGFWGTESGKLFKEHLQVEFTWFYKIWSKKPTFNEPDQIFDAVTACEDVNLWIFRTADEDAPLLDVLRIQKAPSNQYSIFNPNDKMRSADLFLRNIHNDFIFYEDLYTSAMIITEDFKLSLLIHLDRMDTELAAFDHKQAMGFSAQAEINAKILDKQLKSLYEKLAKERVEEVKSSSPVIFSGPVSTVLRSGSPILQARIINPSSRKASSSSSSSSSSSCSSSVSSRASTPHPRYLTPSPPPLLGPRVPAFRIKH